jgi:hypothetical protein
MQEVDLAGCTCLHIAAGLAEPTCVAYAHARCSSCDLRMRSMARAFSISPPSARFSHSHASTHAHTFASFMALGTLSFVHARFIADNWNPNNDTNPPSPFSPPPPSPRILLDVLEAVSCALASDDFTLQQLLNTRNAGGMTPLLCACTHRCLDAVVALHAAGGSPYAVDDGGRSLLHHIAWGAPAEVEDGGPAASTGPPPDLDAVDAGVQACMAWALKTAPELADVGDGGGNSPLHAAASIGCACRGCHSNSTGDALP